MWEADPFGEFKFSSRSMRLLLKLFFVSAHPLNYPEVDLFFFLFIFIFFLLPAYEEKVNSRVASVVYFAIAGRRERAVPHLHGKFWGRERRGTFFERKITHQSVVNAPKKTARKV